MCILPFGKRTISWTFYRQAWAGECRHRVANLLHFHCVSSTNVIDLGQNVKLHRSICICCIQGIADNFFWFVCGSDTICTVRQETLFYLFAFFFSLSPHNFNILHHRNRIQNIVSKMQLHSNFMVIKHDALSLDDDQTWHYAMNDYY